MTRPTPSRPLALVVMGVTGSGKTTVGTLLAERLGWPFLDGDDFHPPENVKKMGSGVPLTDDDREPWLRTLADELARRLEAGGSCLLACSALRQAYRQTLAGERDDVRFIHLRGTPDLIGARLQDRQHRYMPASLLQSQFDTLEMPDDALDVDIDATPDEIAERILAHIVRW